MEEAGRGCVRVPLWGSKAGQVRVGDTAGLPWGARREAGNGQGRQEPALYPGPAHTQAPASCLRPGRLPAARGRACRGPARSLRPRRSLCVWGGGGGVGPARSRGLPGSRTAPGGALRERGHRGGREEELGGGPGPARPGGADYRRQCAAPPVAMVTPLPAGGPQPGPGGRPPSPSLPPSLSSLPAAAADVTAALPAGRARLRAPPPLPVPLTPSWAAPHP